MIDFTQAIEELNSYKGSEKKKTLLYENKRYLVKFPDPVREKNKNISYINNAFSEYVGSNIFRMIGFPTQNTILGKYYYHDKEKIVCACEDFTDSMHVLYEFENLALSTNPDKKIETELSDIMEVLNESIIIDSKVIQNQFWDMFIVDAFIGNTDRHNGNWGFLLDLNTKKLEFSPIYDCGSCLNPLLKDQEMDNMNDTDLKNVAMNTYSCMKENGKKINFMSYITSLKNEECNSALLRVFPCIHFEEIEEFINQISCMSDIRKDFYKEVLKCRYNILSNTYYQLNNL